MVDVVATAEVATAEVSQIHMLSNCLQQQPPPPPLPKAPSAPQSSAQGEWTTSVWRLKRV